MPAVGIFWVCEQTVIGRATSQDSGEEGVPGLIDSPDNHADLWAGEIIPSHPDLRDHEYFDIPRGRVLWDANRERSIVYLDAALLVPEIKTGIASFFGLTEGAVTWRTDAHYNTKKESLKQLFLDDQTFLGQLD